MGSQIAASDDGAGSGPPPMRGRVWLAASLLSSVVQLVTTFAVRAEFGLIVAAWPAGVLGQASAAGYTAAICCVIALLGLAFTCSLQLGAARRIVFIPHLTEIVK